MEHHHTLCPKFEAAFALLGKRWTGLIIESLLNGPKRFREIADMIPKISDRMLVERFKELEKSGIVVRHVYAEIPVRIEYELTEKGKGLQEAMASIQKWAEEWIK